jgi:hypothetical protein
MAINTIKVTGRTFPAASLLRECGFAWNATDKCWTGTADALAELERVSTATYSRSNQKLVAGLKISTSRAVLAAWGHGASTIEAVRESDSDGWECCPEAIAWNQASDGTRIHDDAWCVLLEDTPEMREALDHDSACAGYMSVQ